MMTIAQELKIQIATRLIGIQELIERHGIQLDNIAVIARDPNNDDAVIVIHNEKDHEGFKRACEVAINNVERIA